MTSSLEGSVPTPNSWAREFDAGSGTSKVMTLERAVAEFVAPGMSVHYAYAHARPNALLRTLAREFAGRDPGFTLIVPSLVNIQAALLELGLVRRLVTSFAGETHPTASPNRAIQRALEAGTTTIENWSLWTWVARLQAGALGIPFIPVRSLGGSSLADEHRGSAYAEVDDPFASDGARVGVVAAMRPDITLLHGVMADDLGNVVLSAPFGEAHWGALASRRGVIASVERIATREELRSHRSDVRIPAHAVRAVCPAPLGAHPYGVFAEPRSGTPGYVEDAAFIREVAEAARDPGQFDEWIRTWVLEPATHHEYLAKLGTARISELRGRQSSDLWLIDIPSEAVLGRPGYSATEALVVAAARQIAGRISAAEITSILAGVGLSHLASWLAQHLAAEGGVRVELLTEIGMYGYDPRPGEPFIFSGRNMHTCTSLVDVATMLGAIVSGPDNRCLGAIGAGTIDVHGNVGSTYTRDGRFLIGSGGANDIASAAHEVVVTTRHSPQRLVEEVGYVTSPGRGVSCVVTDICVFERTDPAEPLRLTRVLASDRTIDESIAMARERSRWQFEVAPVVSVEPAPMADELRRIRAFDPDRTILGVD